MREAWCVRRRRIGLKCVVYGCPDEHRSVRLRDVSVQHYMCSRHRAEYDSIEVAPFLSCGCGPELCGACRT